MNRQQAVQWARTCVTLNALGFSPDEVEQLRRIQMTLHRWSEHECNGDVIIDDEGRAYAMLYQSGGQRAYRIANKYAGAIKRLNKIMEGKQGVQAYVQGDPRGCALYIVRDSDVPPGADIESYYSRGIAVCV